MGKPSGFMEYERQDNLVSAPQSRLENYEEFKHPLKEKERRQQAARCMNCGVPFCQSAINISGMVTGCPLHNLIPEWNDEIYRGNYAHALSRLLKTNPFPEFTGRVCPALCEKACLNGIDGDPITVHDNELFIIETAYASGGMKPRQPAVQTTKKVAVIGSGPAGLAAAYDLRHRGHQVTVFERADRPGGLLMYGIPNMKLDKTVIERRIQLMEEEGVQFVLNTDVGKDISKEQLEEQFDAIIIAAGSKQPRDLVMENRDLEGICFAVDYLSQNTAHLLDGTPYISAEGKDVVIVGGGDTGNDCVATALRQQARSVVQIEMMPQPPKERLESNPWPQWPRVEKTDYGQQEAISLFQDDPRIYETTIDVALGEDGHIKAVEGVKVAFEEGRLVKKEETRFQLPCDLLLIAAGFTGVEPYVKESMDVMTSPRNTIATQPDQYQSLNHPHIFTAGDAHRGQSLVVWAIHEGKEAARQVDEYLMGYSNLI